MKELRYGLVGFLLGLIPAFAAFSSSLLGKHFGWFHFIPFEILRVMMPCYAEECLSNWILSILLWPIIGIVGGIFFARFPGIGENKIVKIVLFVLAGIYLLSILLHFLKS